jgi:filamentous hemagglutinin family protein
MFKKFMTVFLCFLILFNQVFPAYAQVIVDTNAAASNQANITNAPNGVDIVNIVTPNASGLSHNKFTAYDVSTTGIILNNSATHGNSILGGTIAGNSNITSGSEASVILNEITSTNQSVINGATEVFGNSADVIVANPNGITCKGCTFINTPTSTLTTGTPIVDGSGILTNFSVDDGTITIEGNGLNNSGNKALILSRAIKVNAEIQANEIEIISGRNDYNPTSGIATPKADNGSVKPSFAIDSSALGGMYAGKITLQGTEEGVGFRLSGDMAASTDDLVISNKGEITLKNASAQNDVQIKTSDEFTISEGTLVGTNNVTIHADTLTNDHSAIVSGNDLLIEGVNAGDKATLIDNYAGTIIAQNGDILMRTQLLKNRADITFDTNVEEVTHNFIYHTPPSWVQNIPGASDQLLDGGRTQTYVMIPHPDVIQTILELEGITIDQWTPNLWKKYAPTNVAEFDKSLWGLVVPDECRNAPAGSYAYGRSIVDTASDYTASNISAFNSGNIEIFADTLENEYSTIDAAGNITLTGTDFYNEGATLYERYQQQLSYSGEPHTHTIGWTANFRGKDGNPVTMYSNVVDNVNSTVAAGNSLNISMSNTVENAASVSEDFSNREKATDTVIVVGEKKGISDVLSLGGGLFKAASDNGDYVYETRFDYTDIGTFYGSEYFIQSVLGTDYDHETISRRLGDSYYDTQNISAQILKQTGKKLLSSDFSTTTEQIKALLDSGVAAASDLNLSFGIALTTEQQAALTNDIVWYETSIINGEEVLVPRLYLADASKALLSSTDGTRAATLSGNNVDITTTTFVNSEGKVFAKDDLNITANEDISIVGGIIAGKDVKLDAGGNIIATTMARETGENINGATIKGAFVERDGQIIASNDITAKATKSIVFSGNQVNAGNNINLEAQNIAVTAQEIERALDYQENTDKKAKITSYDITQKSANLTAGGSVNATAQNDIIVRGSNITANDSINLQATLGDVTIDTATEKSYSRIDSKTRDHTRYKETHVGSTLSTESGNINIGSALGDVTLEAAELNSNNDINIKADAGKVQLLAAVDKDYEQNTGTKSSPLWQSSENKGHDYETVRHTILTGEGSLNITSAQGVTVQYHETGNLSDDIDQLSQAPGLAWMATLKDDPNVDWEGIVAAHEDWYEKQEGLGTAAAVVIAIAIAIATQGMGAELIGIAAESTMGAATSAAFSALVSQATISTINNKGNLGDVFDELATSDTVRNIAAAALTAGLLEGIGVDTGSTLAKDGSIELDLIKSIKLELKGFAIRTAVNTTVRGQELNAETLISDLRFTAAALIGAQVSQEIGEAFAEGDIGRTVQLIAHTATGCVAGAIGGTDCASAAAGQLAGELVALGYDVITEDELHSEINELLSTPEFSKREINAKVIEWKARGANIAKLSGALAAAIAGGDADDINMGAELGGSAAENNALFTTGAALIAAGLFTMEAIDKSLLAYDVYRLERALEAGDEELAAEIASDLAIAGSIEVVAGMVPLSVVMTKVTQKIIKKVDPATAERLTSKLIGKTDSIWNLSPIDRGNEIEKILAKTDYKDWGNVGALNNGKFPLVDFHKGKKIVSLKSVDTNGSTWYKRMEDHITDLGNRGNKATVDGINVEEVILDLRVQPGGLNNPSLAKLKEFASDNKITLKIQEFKQ